MRRFAIAIHDYSEDELDLKIVEVDGDGMAALRKAYRSFTDNLVSQSNVEEALDEACDQDWTFAIEEIDPDPSAQGNDDE